MTYNPQQTGGSRLQGGSSLLRVQPAVGASFLQPAVSPVGKTMAPAVRTASNSANTSVRGSTGGTGYVDPYAAWGGTARFNQLKSGFDTQKGNIYTTSNETAKNAALGRHSSILDWLDEMRRGQNALNERGVQNELAKKQGMNSITDMLGRGLRSGGTLLANKNALTSSAAEGIARAYSDIGRREATGVNQDFELENRSIGLAQDEFGQSKNTGLRKFEESKQQSIGQIVIDARNKLAALDASMVSANMPQRFAIDAEKNSIQNQVAGILGQYDAELQQGAASIAPTTADQRRMTAFDLANKGVAANNPFDFTSEVPAQFQNSGPFASDIPLFSYNRRKTSPA